MRKMTFRLTGTVPLLMHNGRLSNPLDPIVKEMKIITGKRKKTDEDYEALFWAEFRGGIYFKEKIGPYIPSLNIEASIREGAKLSKRGKDIQRGLSVFEDAPLIYKGPKTVEGLWKGGFHLISPVGIGQSKTQRCRPCFNEWSCEFTALYNPEIITGDDELAAIVKTCGELTGMLDWRPRYGKFTSEVIK